MDVYPFKKTPLEEDYEIGDDIGSGHFAVVRRVTHKKSGNAFAAKFIRKRRGGGRKGARMEDIHKEVNILRQLNHNNVISLYDVYETNIEVILILELVTGGELFDYISEKDHLGEEEASAFIGQILHGLKHLHDKNIAHLDLKPENIMLLSRNSQKIKLIDFGLAQRLTDKEDIRALMGTAEFVAPEVVSYESLSLATDMWSIGVITYILLSGASPFLGDSQQETYHNITAINYQFDQEYFEHTSDLAKDFIRKLFVKNPRKRATVDDCLNHAWIRPKEPTHAEERKSAVININNLKAFMARKRWKQSMRVVSLCNRLSKSMLLRKSTDTLGSRNTLDEEKTSKLTTVSEAQANDSGAITCKSDANLSNAHEEAVTSHEQDAKSQELEENSLEGTTQESQKPPPPNERNDFTGSESSGSTNDPDHNRLQSTKNKEQSSQETTQESLTPSVNNGASVPTGSESSNSSGESNIPDHNTPQSRNTENISQQATHESVQPSLHEIKSGPDSSSIEIHVKMRKGGTQAVIIPREEINPADKGKQSSADTGKQSVDASGDLGTAGVDNDTQGVENCYDGTGDEQKVCSDETEISSDVSSEKRHSPEIVSDQASSKNCDSSILNVETGTEEAQSPEVVSDQQSSTKEISSSDNIIECEGDACVASPSTDSDSTEVLSSTLNNNNNKEQGGLAVLCAEENAEVTVTCGNESVVNEGGEDNKEKPGTGSDADSGLSTLSSMSVKSLVKSMNKANIKNENKIATEIKKTKTKTSNTVLNNVSEGREKDKIGQGQSQKDTNKMCPTDDTSDVNNEKMQSQDTEEEYHQKSVKDLVGRIEKAKHRPCPSQPTPNHIRGRNSKEREILKDCEK